MKPNKVGIALGLFLGLMHAIWEVVVFSGSAQKFLNWKFAMHSLNNPFKVMPFDLGQAVFLVITTIIAGYFIGAIFSVIFNKFAK